VSTAVAVLLVALGLGLVVSVWVVRAQAEQSFTRSASGFDAVLGARGSKLQLVLNGLFHQEASPGNITADDYKEIRDLPFVDRTLPIVVGDEAFHLELVRDPAEGTLRAYVLDGEMEDFVRIGAPRLTLEVDREGRKDTLALLPVADLATGETAGDTCLFQAQAGWLKTADHFKGVFRDLKIQDQTFKAVPFDFPGGNGKD
jgi:hypothetical protein